MHESPRRQGREFPQDDDDHTTKNCKTLKEAEVHGKQTNIRGVGEKPPDEKITRKSEKKSKVFFTS